MGDDWRYREAGDRLATLREMGDSAKIGLSPGGRWEILTLCPPHLYLSLSFYLEAFLDFPVFRLKILACMRDEYFSFCPLELALKEDFEKKAWIE